MTERFAERKKILEGSESDFEERDLLPHHILEDAEARDGFGVEGDSFTALLVGEDGAEKARSGRSIEAGGIFRRIDGTRRCEMGA